MTQPVVYIPHGGGPLPLLGDENHRELVEFLQELPKLWQRPDAILVVSAHWESPVATVSSAAHPEMIYDYHGFPKEAYKLAYAAPGSTTLADKVIALLATTGIDARDDDSRGFDHGTFVPLKLMYPEANIPVVQLSLLNNLNARDHLAIGEAIGSLMTQNVLLLGSGSSFHNMSAFFGNEPAAVERSRAFDQWLNDIVLNRDYSYADKSDALIGWDKAPFARYAHPREEHLLPLHVCFGAARSAGYAPQSVFNGNLFGMCMSGFLWHKPL